jgi:hypothetical protein
MKPQTKNIAAVALLVAILQIPLVAQVQHTTKEESTNYTVVNLGALGGTQSAEMSTLQSTRCLCEISELSPGRTKRWSRVRRTP